VQRNQLVEVDVGLWQVNHLHGMKMMTRDDNNDRDNERQGQGVMRRTHVMWDKDKDNVGNMKQ
jgi:hypothetical protein